METKETLKSEEMNLAKEELTDLAVADEQSGETKGGLQTKSTPTLMLAVADGDN